MSKVIKVWKPDRTGQVCVDAEKIAEFNNIACAGRLYRTKVYYVNFETKANTEGLKLQHEEPLKGKFLYDELTGIMIDYGTSRKKLIDYWNSTLHDKYYKLINSRQYVNILLKKRRDDYD